jgi:hypothetical protein
MLYLALSGCAAQTPAPLLAPPLPLVGDEPGCDAAAASRLVGRPANDATGAEALRLSGAAMLRWIRPRDGVTSDYVTSRLNIDVDERGRIVGMGCG